MPQVSKLNLFRLRLSSVLILVGFGVVCLSLLADVSGLSPDAGFGRTQRDLVLWGTGVMLYGGGLLYLQARSGRAAEVSAQRGPIELPVTSTFRRAGETVLGSLLVVAVMNIAAMSYVETHLADSGRQTMTAKWRILLSLEHPVDWVVLGDSSCNQGVVPAELNIALGGSSLNLCTIALATAVNEAMMFESYIEKFGPPRGVILVNAFGMTAERFEPLVLAKTQVPWGLVEGLRFSPETISAKDQLTTAVARYVPLYFDNREIRGAVTKAVRSPITLFDRAPRVTLTPDGYMRSDRSELPEDIVETIENEDLGAGEIVLRPAVVKGILRILDLAEEHGVPVFATAGPIYEGVAASHKFQHQYERIRAWWTSLDAERESLRYFPGFETFPRELMADAATHVVHEAAVQYTRKLGRRVHASLASDQPALARAH